MRVLTKQGKKDPLVRRVALNLTQHLKQKDRMGEVRAIFNFIRDRIRYVRDINGVETLHEAQQVLKQSSGDCDDKCILLASMLESIGYPTRFVALAFAPNQYTHVIVETRPYGKWIALETTLPVRMGWTPPKVVNRMVVHNR